MHPVSAKAWALEQFGGADLGNARRRARVVAIAAAVVAQPTSPVAAVFREDPPRRQAAYRLLENAAVGAQALGASALAAGARAVGDERIVFVPVDGATLTLPARGDCGPVASKAAAAGAHVMSALILDQAGAPAGLGAQAYWTRTAIEFARDEIDATSLLHKPVGVARGDAPRVGHVVRWIANLGGYSTYARHQPGTIVRARGLADVLVVARMLAALRDPPHV